MEKIRCESCGAGDLVREGGFYVCPYCGTKYAPDRFSRAEALDNRYILARRARKNGDRPRARSLYEEILLEDPLNWEPVFFTASLQGDPVLLSRMLGEVLDLVKKEKDPDRRKPIAREISEGVLDLSERDPRLFSSLSAVEAFYEMGDRIEAAYPEDPDWIRAAAAVWREALMNDPEETRAADYLGKCVEASPNREKVRDAQWKVVSLLQGKLDLMKKLRALLALERGMIGVGFVLILALILNLFFSWGIGLFCLIALLLLFLAYWVVEVAAARALRSKVAKQRDAVLQQIAAVEKML